MKNIILIGMMGCGKTTCGKLLSQMTGRALVDTDQLITRRTGLTPSQIFEQQGEEAFRDLETELCRELTRQSDLIIATGGGLPLREENRRLLRQSGTVVYLYRAPEEIYQPDKLADRPLARQGREDFLAKFARRAPIYEQTAHVKVVSAPVKTDTARRVLKAVEAFWSAEE